VNGSGLAGWGTAAATALAGIVNGYFSSQEMAAKTAAKAAQDLANSQTTMELMRLLAECGQ